VYMCLCGFCLRFLCVFRLFVFVCFFCGVHCGVHCGVRCRCALWCALWCALSVCIVGVRFYLQVWVFVFFGVLLI